MDFCNFMQYVSIGSFVASGIIIAFGCLVLLVSICNIDLDFMCDSLIVIGVGAAFAIITFFSKNYYTKAFTEMAQNAETQIKEVFLLPIAVVTPFSVIILTSIFIFIFFSAAFAVSDKDVDNAEKEMEKAEKHKKTEEYEEDPDNCSLYDECVSYNCLISEWGKKATEFQDDDFANILYNIAEKLRDLEKYRKRELISNNVVNKVYNIYLQDFKEYQKEYCAYIDVKEEASKEIIKSVKESVVLIQALLTEITQTEIEKDVEMKRTQISASRKSLEAIITQHGYILKNKA